MKLKKLALNAIALEHSEMKSIKAGYYGEYECYGIAEDWYNDTTRIGCETQSGNSCMTNIGELGRCGFTGTTMGSCGCIAD